MNFEQKNVLKTPEKKAFFEKVRKGIDRRLQALAVAGFLTVGLSSEAGADQLKLTKPEKGSPNFVMEDVVTSEKLTKFKEKIKAEEPEFFAWGENCIFSMKNSLDEMMAEISNFNPERGGKEEGGNKLTKQNMEIIKKLKANKNFALVEQLLKDNVDNIFWRFVLLDDSHAVREDMQKNVGNPAIKFQYNQTAELGQGRLAVTVLLPQNEGGKLVAEMRLSPTSFTGSDGEIDLNLFVNTVVHEFWHTLHPGSQEKDPTRMTGFQSNMIEGLAQNATFEVVQSITDGTNIKGLRPGVAMNRFDELVVMSSLTNAIIRSSSTPDLLAKWNAGLIKEGEFLSKFKILLSELGLDPEMASDLARLSSPNKEMAEVYNPGIKVYENMLARLKIAGYTLSPKFVEGILTSGRALDDAQRQNLKWNLKIIDLDSNVSKQVKKLKNE